jgi:hypothetical protein
MQVRIRIRTQLFTSMRIRIQGAKPTWARIQILVILSRREKLDSEIKNILYLGNMSKNIPTKVQKAGKGQGNLLILTNFLAPGSGSGFPIQIWIRINESKINADGDHLWLLGGGEGRGFHSTCTTNVNECSIIRSQQKDKKKKKKTN